MPQLKELIGKESQRADIAACAVIHLVKEGSFYRAYEWSAWLTVHYYTELKVTHRVLKSGEDFTFVGFPVASLDRYTPAESVVRESEAGVDIVLPVSVFSPDATPESLGEGFENWKRSQPLTEASKKQVAEERAAAERGAHPRLTDVMRSIMAYPVEQHSPMECMAFLAEVKRQIAEMV